MKLWIQVLALLMLYGCKEDLATNSPSAPYEIPELIPVGGIPESYEWQFRNGPDFYTYLAELDASGVSIYFGTHPHFELNNRKEKDSTTFLSARADWFEFQHNSHPMVWEALVPYQHSSTHIELKLHVWIWGPDEERVRALANHLESLSFDQTTYEERKVNRVAEGI